MVYDGLWWSMGDVSYQFISYREKGLHIHSILWNGPLTRKWVESHQDATQRAPSNGGLARCRLHGDVTRCHQVIWCHMLLPFEEAMKWEIMRNPTSPISLYLLDGTASGNQLTTVHLFAFLQPHDVHTVGSCAMLCTNHWYLWVAKGWALMQFHSTSTTIWINMIVQACSGWKELYVESLHFLRKKQKRSNAVSAQQSGLLYR